MESVRSRIKMELVSNEQRLQKLINKSTFKYCTNYEHKNITAVTLENKIIDFFKPIYIGKYFTHVQLGIYYYILINIF